MSGTISDLQEQQAPDLAQALLERAQTEPSEAAQQLADVARDDPQLALNVVQALGRTATLQAAHLLAVAADSDLDKKLRKEARRGLHRLKGRGIETPAAARSVRDDAAATLQRLSKTYEAWATLPDGVGTRVLWLLAERPLGGIHALALLLNDVVGVKRSTLHETTRKRFSAQLDAWRRESPAAWVSLPVDYAAQLVGEALTLNARSGYRLPHDFEVHRQQIERIDQPFEQALVYREISPGAARLAPDWEHGSPRLLDELELSDWLFNYDDLRPFVEQMREAQASRVLITPEGGPERVERIVGEAIANVVTPELRQALKRRLEEIAFILLRAGRESLARLAVAAAVGLEEAMVSPLLVDRSDRRLDQRPFLRRMMRRSLDVAIEAEQRGMGWEMIRRSPYDRVE